MTQTTQAFGQVATVAAFRSVVDRLISFDAAIDQAQALRDGGPAHAASPAGRPGIDLEDVDLFLPDGRRIVEATRLALASGESVAVSRPSGSGKSTLFRAVAAIWPYGAGRIRVPEDDNLMVVPPKPYIPIGTLRAAVTYPAMPGTYSDEDIRSALMDVHPATWLTNSIARTLGRSTCRAVSSSGLRSPALY